MKKGSTIIEVIIALAIFMIGITAIINLLLEQVKNAGTNSQNLVAIDIAEQGLEGARKIRDNSWYALTAGSHGLSTSGGNITFSETSDTANNITRTITVSNIDINTRLVTSTATWKATFARSRSISISSIFTNWRSFGGQLLSGDWSKPIVTAPLIIPNAGNGGTSVAIKNGILYLGTALDNAYQKDFNIIDVNNPASPVLLSQMNTNNKGTEDVAIQGNYAYLADRDNHYEMHIIDISNPLSPIKISSLEIPNLEKRSYTVAVKDNYVYLGTDSSPNTGEFFVIDVSNPANPIIKKSFEFVKAVRDIFIKNNTAYLAIEFSNYGELVAIDITSPANAGIIGNYNASGYEPGYGVTANANGIITLVRRKDNSDSDPELINLDMSNPVTPIYLGGLNPNNDFEKVLRVDNKIFTTLDRAINDLEIYDVTNPATPSFVASETLLNDAEDMAFENNLLFVAVRSTDHPFAIITSTPN
ncbi:MAG: hypothetical protein UT32_C0024G0004 [Parcubacteria group bacterium GW2011_GWC2_39_14]|nr:MAG: hypothetical protein UT32_C0024G0004 [Parcubacteria group bacterium GW2011_GWC2_39_14]